MTATLAFTWSDMLVGILLALLVGAFFGRMIAKEARQFFRPGVGELMLRESQERGAQVLRLAGLSNARLIGNEREGDLRRADLADPEPEPISVPDKWTPRPSADAETHSEN